MKRVMDIILIVFAALVPMLVALNSYKDSKRAEKATEEANRKLTDKQDQLNAKQEELNRSLQINVETFKKLNEKQNELNTNQQTYSTQIIQLQNELREKQNALQQRTDEVIVFQKQNLNELTGGDSYCVVDVRISKTYEGLFEQHTTVLNKGGNLLRGVTVLIDVPLWSRSSDNPLLAGRVSGQQFAYGPLDVPPKSGIYLGAEKISPELMRSRMTYLAQIQIPKGFYQQHIMLALIKNIQYRTASKIQPNKMGISYEEIDPLFPKDKNGRIEWRIFQKDESTRLER